MKLNLGCGNDLKKDFVNIDIIEPYDLKLDIEKEKFPFLDNSVDYIVCERTLEHLSDITNVMLESYRVLKQGGKLRITCWYSRHPMAFQPSHKIFFNIHSLEMWYGKVSDMNYPISFKKESVRLYHFPKKWEWLSKKILKWNPDIYQNLFAIFFPAKQIEFILVKKEGDENNDT